MGILFPHDKLWGVSNWIAKNFFRDCLPHLDQTPDLVGKIRFCVAAELDTLDFRNEEANSIEMLEILIEQVIEDNERLQGNNFKQPEYFPVYMEKLNELARLVAEISPQKHSDREIDKRMLNNQKTYHPAWLICQNCKVKVRLGSAEFDHERVRKIHPGDYLPEAEKLTLYHNIWKIFEDHAGHKLRVITSRGAACLRLKIYKDISGGKDE